MEFFGFRVHVVLIALLVTVGVLLGGYHLYQAYMLDNSLVRQIEQVDGVTRAEILRANGTMTVKVWMGSVDDLQAAYEQLLDVTGGVLDLQQVTFRVVDKRNEHLRSAYDDVKFLALEAASTGRFSLLQNETDELKSKWGLSQAHISVSDTDIFVQLDDGSGYLYEIIPRTDQPSKGDNT